MIMLISGRKWVTLMHRQRMISTHHIQIITRHEINEQDVNL
uniref:Major facilitator superfamily (MFS) profile domain-containing protein n=1 Tax=Parascaris univalens TaxID=6257 RepID=A0A915A4J7_PARUN